MRVWGVHPCGDRKYAQASESTGDRGATWRIDGVSDEWRVASGEKNRRKLVPPLPLGFSQVLILKGVKVVCFDTLLQVLILKIVKVAVSVELGGERRKG
jgi:hypothetical protein